VTHSPRPRDTLPPAPSNLEGELLNFEGELLNLEGELLNLEGELLMSVHGRDTACHACVRQRWLKTPPLPLPFGKGEGMRPGYASGYRELAVAQNPSPLGKERELAELTC